MNPSFVVYISRHALETAILISGPMLIACLVVGLIITIIQAVTAIRDMTLAIVPKLLAMGIVGLIFGGWMLQVMMRFFVEVFSYIQQIGR